MYGTISYAGIAYSGDPIVTAVTRAVVEAIGSNDNYSPEIKRLVLEAVGSNDHTAPTVSRLVLEAIGDAYTGPGGITEAVTRTVLEVLGAASQFEGKRPQISRIVAEIVAELAERRKGFDIPAQSTAQMSVFMVLDPAAWTSGGQVVLQQGSAPAVRVSGNATTTIIRLTDGVRYAEHSMATPAGAFLLTLVSGIDTAACQIRVNKVAVAKTTSGTTWTTFAFDAMNVHTPPEYPGAGQVAELLVYNSSLSNADRDVVETYLWTKWPI